MRRTVLVLVALTAAGLAGGEEASYRRLLQGEDAKQAEALQKQVDDLWAAGKCAEARKVAEELLALRKRLQGEDHWQAADAARQVEDLKRETALPAAKPGALDEVPALWARGWELHNGGKSGEAEPLFRKILEIRQQVLGPQHPQTARSHLVLAAMVQARGRYAEAEPLNRKALALLEEAFGPRHPETATAGNNLAINLERLGQARQAEPLFRKILAIREEALGARHPHTVQSCGNLANNLDAQGRAREAEPLHRKALAGWEDVWGPRHADTAQGCNSLATNLQRQGRAREAEPLYRQALAIFEEVRGPRHPDTARAYNNLATSLDAQGRAREAEVLFRKALAIFEETWGPKNAETANTSTNLAHNLQRQGRTREAEPFMRQALFVRVEVLGKDHPDIARSYEGMASLLEAQGVVRMAEGLYRAALLRREKALGPNHPETAASINLLALNFGVQGRHKEAEALFRKALAIREEALGPRHPDTATSLNNLAGNMQKQGQAAEAEPLLRRALAVWEEVLGPRHPDTALGYNNLAFNLQAQGKAREAEPLFRKALAIREEVLGRNHPDTAQSRTNLATNLQAQGRAPEAEPLWQAGVEAVEAARLRLASNILLRTGIRDRPHLGLAACRARLGKPAEAWAAAEAGLARGLLDDLAARAALPPDPDAERRARDRAARREAIDKLLLPLLTSARLDEAGRQRRDEYVKERAALDEAAAREEAERSRRAVLPLEQIQARLGPEEALVFWVDLPQSQDRWGCVLRRKGPPAWVRLPGSGPGGEWTAEDVRLPFLLYDDLARGEAEAERRARRLAAQRLDPLAPHLAAADGLPAARRLLVVPTGNMAAIPVEVLTDRHEVSYVPSGSVLVRLREKHRPLESPTLLALADPNYTRPASAPPPEPPDHGLYLIQVSPDSNAARAGLRAGDVLLSYGGTRLKSPADFKLVEAGGPVSVVVWRDGKTLDSLRVGPGKLGAQYSLAPATVALRESRELDLLLDGPSRDEVPPLPGTRLEATAIAGLLPADRSLLLVGSRASAQELVELDAAGKLKDFRLLHLAAHGKIDPVSWVSASLLLARDRMPGPGEWRRLRAAGEQPPQDRLWVTTVAYKWKDLDADLVTLSACRTAVGPDGGGEGLLGFTQVLLGKGARSVLLSLWKVDDTATALLMTRFYQNLLGQREGLKAPLSKAESLQEAKAWLRALRRAGVEELSGKLARGVVRAAEEPAGESLPALPAGETPFAHPRYWAAFILIGDPE